MINKRKLLVLDCQKAEEFCDKAEYQESNIAGKLKLKLHLYFCQKCRKYHERNKKLSQLLQKASITTCTKEEKRAFQLQLEKERSKHLN